MALPAERDAFSVPAQRRVAPPRGTPNSADALKALLHTRLTVELKDGRVLLGHLLAVDNSASLLLSSVRERRVLPDTEKGKNVAWYYPISQDGMPDDDVFHGQPAPDARTRVRDLASILVPMEQVARVHMSDDDAAMWGRYSGVEFQHGNAVPPGQESKCM